MNEAMEQWASESLSFGSRPFEFGGIDLSTGAAATLPDALMEGLGDDLWTRPKPGVLNDVEVIKLYRLVMASGLWHGTETLSTARSEACLSGQHPVPAPPSGAPLHPTVGERLLPPP